MFPPMPPQHQEPDRGDRADGCGQPFRAVHQRKRIGQDDEPGNGDKGSRDPAQGGDPETGHHNRVHNLTGGTHKQGGDDLHDQTGPRAKPEEVVQESQHKDHAASRGKRQIWPGPDVLDRAKHLGRPQRAEETCAEKREGDSEPAQGRERPASRKITGATVHRSQPYGKAHDRGC